MGLGWDADMRCDFNKDPPQGERARREKNEGLRAHKRLPGGGDGLVTWFLPLHGK